MTLFAWERFDTSGSVTCVAGSYSRYTLCVNTGAGHLLCLYRFAVFCVQLPLDLRQSSFLLKVPTTKMVLLQPVSLQTRLEQNTCILGTATFNSLKCVKDIIFICPQWIVIHVFYCSATTFVILEAFKYDCKSLLYRIL